MKSDDEDQRKEDQRKDELINQLVEKRFEYERVRRDKIEEQSRSLVASILVVVGFLLAAGTTSVVDVLSVTSLLYFVGIGILVSSIVTVSIILRRNMRFNEINVQEILRVYEDKQWTPETILKQLAISRGDMHELNQELNDRKEMLLTIAWFLLIVGLISVLLFIVLTILL